MIHDTPWIYCMDVSKSVLMCAILLRLNQTTYRKFMFYQTISNRSSSFHKQIVICPCERVPTSYCRILRTDWDSP